MGIFNNWYLDSNDSSCNNQENVGGVSSSSSFNSVRYIDFDELKSSSKWILDAMFFSDVISVTNSNGYVSKRILTYAHNNEKGLYITDLYAFDSKGQQIGEYSRLTAEIK